jgi:hypothetical protein
MFTITFIYKCDQSQGKEPWQLSRYSD